MTSYILILVTSATLFGFGNDSVSVSEWSSKDACETALVEAKKEWATKDDKSRCVAVKDRLGLKECKAKCLNSHMLMNSYEFNSGVCMCKDK